MTWPGRTEKGLGSLLPVRRYHDSHDPARPCQHSDQGSVQTRWKDHYKCAFADTYAYKLLTLHAVSGGTGAVGATVGKAILEVGGDIVILDMAPAADSKMWGLFVDIAIYHP